MGAIKPKTVPTSTTQTTSNEINKFVDRNIDASNQLANAYVTGGGTQAYTGDLQGAQSAQSQQALGGIMNVANSANASLLGNTGLNYANKLIGQQGLSDEMRAQLKPLIDTANGVDLNRVNPYLQTQIDAMNQQIMDKVNGAMSANGRYGSGAHTGVLGSQLGVANANVLSTNFENSLNRQQAALGSLADIYGQGLNRAGNMALNGSQITDQLYSPYERMAGVGQYYDDRAQGAVDAQLQKYMMNRDLKKDDLTWLAQIASGAPSYGSTSTSSGTTTKPSALQSALGAGASLGGLLGKLF